MLGTRAREAAARRVLGGFAVACGLVTPRARADTPVVAAPAAASSAQADAGSAPPPASPPAPARGPADASGAPAYPPWTARIGFGWMVPGPSEHQDVLSLDEYGNPLRTGVAAAGDYWLGRVVGVGGWGEAWWRNTSARYGGPDYHESSYLLGAELPLRVGNTVVRVAGVPRLGLAWSTHDFGGDAPASLAFAYGLEGVLWFPRVYLGLTLGWMRAAARTSGDLGLTADAGGWYFMLNGVIDG